MEMVAVGANGNERRVRSLEGIMAPVGLPVGGQIALTLKASTGKAGQRISLRLLDGGEIVVDPAISMAGDGPSFTFKAGDTRGLYRVEVTIGSEQYELQLYAAKPPPGAVGVVEP